MTSLAVGSRDIPFVEVWRALVDFDGRTADLIVRDQRAPRTLVGAVAGLALGVAGTVAQAHTRNPLADPGLLGVTAGAAFAVCLGIATFGVTTLDGQVWLALLGALVTSAAVFVLGGTRSGSTTPVTLALTGAAVTAFLTALTSALVLLESSTLDNFRFWTVGSLAGRDLAVLQDVSPFLVLGLLCAIIGIPGMNALALGEDVARSLGQRIGLVRVLGISTVALLTGGAVAAVGPLVFVGLLAPHVARAVTGPDHRWLVPYSGLVGAVLVLLADTAGRRVLQPEEVQVGIMVALVGAPLFVVLVRRRRLVTT